jgi:uncharacterized protein (TIGR02231 family)
MDITTTVTAAELYPTQAQVTRSGALKVEPGLIRVRAGGIPTGAQADSLRVSGRGTALATLRGARLEVEQLQQPAADAVRALEAELEQVQDQDAVAAARAASLERELKQLEAIGAQSEHFARGLMVRGQSVAEAGAVFDFIRTRTQALQTEVQAVVRERRDLARRIDQLRRQLAGLRQPSAPQALVAHIELEVQAAGELTLDLSYVIHQAGWSPAYDLRLEPPGLQVDYLARVHQSTGEDWEAVALTLSTAQPSLADRVPELDPWYLSPLPPPAPLRARKSAGPELMAQALAAPAPAPDELEFERAAVVDVVAAGASVDASGSSLVFRLGHGADVPGGGDPRTVTIGQFALKPEIDHVSAPRLNAVCYRRAKGVNTSPYVLLPGPAQIFEGQAYLGAITLDYIARGQEVELFLGSDGQVQIERELTAREVDKNFFGDRRRTRFGYAIKVHNLRADPTVLVVRDQLPVATDEQIKVKLESAEPKPTNHSDLNQLEWRLPLDAGAQAELRLTFSVEHPRGMAVTGL